MKTSGIFLPSELNHLPAHQAFMFEMLVLVGVMMVFICMVAMLVGLVYLIYRARKKDREKPAAAHNPDMVTWNGGGEPYNVNDLPTFHHMNGKSSSQEPTLH